MEDGRDSLFQFVQNIHKCIQSGQLEISEWLKLVKLIFIQMIECIEYLHSKNVAHMDVSLENMLISDVQIQCATDGTNMKFCFDKHIQSKLCDFGLAQYFKDGNSMSTKFCGMYLAFYNFD